MLFVRVVMRVLFLLFLLLVVRVRFGPLRNARSEQQHKLLSQSSNMSESGRGTHRKHGRRNGARGGDFARAVCSGAAAGHGLRHVIGAVSSRRVLSRITRSGACMAVVCKIRDVLRCAVLCCSVCNQSLPSLCVAFEVIRVLSVHE